MRDEEKIGLTAAFMLAAAPAITSAPNYRPSAPMSANETAIVILGGITILAFGAMLIALWNRFNRPPAASSRS